MRPERDPTSRPPKVEVTARVIERKEEVVTLLLPPPGSPPGLHALTPRWRKVLATETSSYSPSWRNKAAPAEKSVAEAEAEHGGGAESEGALEWAKSDSVEAVLSAHGGPLGARVASKIYI